MILSERELELGQDHTGILVLAEPYEPGTPLGDVLPLAEDVLEIETTPNRPDLLSVYGIAREVAALTSGELQPMPGASEPRDRPARSASRSRSRTSTAARVYIGRLFRDVTIAPSPPWLQGQADVRRACARSRTSST